MPTVRGSVAACVAALCLGAQCRSTSPTPTIQPNTATVPEPAPSETAPSTAIDLRDLITVDRTIRSEQPPRAGGSFDRARNKLAFEMRNVAAFTIDLAAIPVDWSRPVILSLDRVPVELRRRDTRQLHFERNTQGAWSIVEPPKGP